MEHEHEHEFVLEIPEFEHLSYEVEEGIAADAALIPKAPWPQYALLTYASSVCKQNTTSV